MAAHEGRRSWRRGTAAARAGGGGGRRPVLLRLDWIGLIDRSSRSDQITGIDRKDRRPSLIALDRARTSLPPSRRRDSSRGGASPGGGTVDNDRATARRGALPRPCGARCGGCGWDGGEVPCHRSLVFCVPSRGSVSTHRRASRRPRDHGEQPLAKHPTAEHSCCVGGSGRGGA